VAFAMPFTGRAALGRRGAPRARSLLVRTVPALLLLAGAALLAKPWEGVTPSPAGSEGVDLLPRTSANAFDPAAIVGGLLVVGGLLFFLPAIVKKLAPAAGRHGQIDVVEARPLGGRNSLLLVDVAGRRLLLGASEHGISTLAELPPVPQQEPRKRDFALALERERAG